MKHTTTEEALKKATGLSVKKGKRDYMRNPQSWYQQGDHWNMTLVSAEKIGYNCMVSNEDIDKVRSYRWYWNNGYAVTSIVYKKVRMPHLIIGKPPKGLEFDHINRNRLDNRRENLRFVTRLQNSQNIALGKGMRKRGKNWEAMIQVDSKQKYLGMFDSPAEAREAYVSAKKEFHPIATHLAEGV